MGRNTYELLKSVSHLVWHDKKTDGARYNGWCGGYEIW